MICYVTKLHDCVLLTVIYLFINLMALINYAHLQLKTLK